MPVERVRGRGVTRGSECHEGVVIPRGGSNSTRGRDVTAPAINAEDYP